MPLKLFLAVAALLLVTACSVTPPRTNDAEPLSDTVPVESPAAAAETTAATQPEAQVTIDPQATAVTFQIDGGSVGFCDELTITADGNYTLTVCDTPPMTGRLAQSDRISLQTWLENLAGFDLATEGDNNLSAALTFAGVGPTSADATQQQVIYDWVNGLAVRLRPQPQVEMPPTPTLPPPSPAGVCPNIPRPALMLIDIENASTITLRNIDSQDTCDITLAQPPFGRIAAANGSLFYPVADQEAKTITIWQLDPTGNQMPLPFTVITMEEPGPYDFVVSPDGAKIAWGHTVIDAEAEPPVYQNFLTVANVDGSQMVTLLSGDGGETAEIVAPIRFSIDNTLYYSLQPDLGGPIFGGRFDTLYTVPPGDRQAALLYDCPTEENPMCITGLANDGSVFTVIDPTSDALLVQDHSGAALATIPLPATDYLERATFAPGGGVAFVSATLTEPASEEEPPLPNPGYITYLAAPYDGQPQTLHSDNHVATLLGWIDDEQLVYGSLDSAGETGLVLLTLTGETFDISTDKFAVGVFRE